MTEIASCAPRHPTARPYAARVRRLAIRAAKNSRNRATATGPASTISRGNASRSPAAARAGRLSRLDERLELLVVVRQRLGERVEPPDGVLRAAEAHLDPAGLDRHACGQAGEPSLERLAGAPRPGSR